MSSLFIFYNITISWLFLPDGFWFIFLLRDSENDLYFPTSQQPYWCSERGPCWCTIPERAELFTYIIHWNICISAFHLSKNTLLSPAKRSQYLNATSSGDKVALILPMFALLSTQHIATLLGVPCCVRLAILLRCVGTCWVLLAQIWKRSHFSWNICTRLARFVRPCMPTSLIFNTQHVLTRRNTLAKRSQHVEILRSFGRSVQVMGQQCCELLAGVLLDLIANRCRVMGSYRCLEKWVRASSPPLPLNRCSFKSSWRRPSGTGPQKAVEINLLNIMRKKQKNLRCTADQRWYVVHRRGNETISTKKCRLNHHKE